MTDSVQILDAGWQMPLNTSTGLPLVDGIIYFFTAGTTTPLTVYSNEALSTSLGTSVSCNSSGFPISGGSTKTLIYTGTAAYKIRITSVIGGGTVAEFDNVKGAVGTSTFLTAATAARKSVVAETSNRSVGVSDLGKLINVNCTSGALTMTIGAASTLADGWWVGIRHDGTANQVKIAGNGTDTFGLNGVNVTSFSLTGRGHVVYIVCNGTSFKIDGEVPALIGNTVGVIAIADRLSTPPGSPTPGDRYIVGATPTGAWSTFAQHDIAEASGSSTWFKYTPPTNCGWRAYVQDEAVNYQFRGSAWVPGAPSPTVQRFTSGSGTYTPPAGLGYIRGRMPGGGGGGGALATNNGVTGGTSSFGTWTAIGGTGGSNSGVANAGGAGGTGGVDGAGTLITRFSGSPGQNGATISSSSAPGAIGGVGVFGGWSRPFNNATSGSAQANTGSGGSGAWPNNGSSAGGGGAGEYVEFFMTAAQIGASLSYTVGAGGAGGAAGTIAGGAGAAGCILIEEYYA